MDTAAFTTWLGGIEHLDPAQRAEAFRELALAEADDPIDPSAQAVAAAVLLYEAAVAPSLPVAEADAAAPEEDLLSKVGRGRIARFGCPHCGEDDVRPWGKAGGKPRYRCTSCRKTFNPLTGTPLAGLHHRDRWPDQAQALIAGETVAKAAERCKVAYTTAFRWRHRFLSALNLDKPARLSGIVEVDETFILESFKGKRRDLPRASRKRGGKAAKRGLSARNIDHRRPRPHRRDDRCRPAAARCRQHHGRTRPGHYPASGTVLRWRRGDHRIRSARPGQVPCLARTRHAQAGGARSPHQQRERLPRPAEGVDAALPWRRHQEPAELSELAANDRGPLKKLDPGRLDHGRRRIGSLSTGSDIRAKSFPLIPRSPPGDERNAMPAPCPTPQAAAAFLILLIDTPNPLGAKCARAAVLPVAALCRTRARERVMGT